MAIKYALHPNPLTSNPEDHRAMVRNQTSRTINDIIDRMIDGGSTITKADALSVIEEFEAAVISFIEDGDSVSTSLFRISSSVAGNFSGLDDRFDADRHELRLNMKAGERLRRAIKDMALQKVQSNRRRPALSEFIDHESGSSSQTLTPGGVGELRGKLLKLDPADNRQGIYFIASDGTETKVTSLIRNKPSNLFFGIPDNLPNGEYKLEVRSIVKRTSKLRSGRLKDSLSVP